MRRPSEDLMDDYWEWRGVDERPGDWEKDAVNADVPADDWEARLEEVERGADVE